MLATALIPAVAAGKGPPDGKHLELSVVSSPPGLVSGGDARVEVAVPDKTALGDVTVELNGVDVTALFGPDPEGNHQLEGLVTGLSEGASTLVAHTGPGKGKKHQAELELVNHSIDGPMFSGPRQDPFFCSIPAHLAKVGLGPILDAATLPDGDGHAVHLPLDRERVEALRPERPPPGRHGHDDADGRHRPSTSSSAGRRGRSTASSTRSRCSRPEPDVPPDLTLERRAASTSSRAASRSATTRGTRARAMLYLPGLAHGYAIAYSTGDMTGTHYNLQLGGETAIMVKDRFVSAYGEPRYTVGVGGSGGAIQQYVYGQNHPGLLDAAIPQYSYPDMVTQTIHVGDCELLERWADAKAIASPASIWRTGSTAR